jgi:hypothetical protein
MIKRKINYMRIIKRGANLAIGKNGKILDFKCQLENSGKTPEEILKNNYGNGQMFLVSENANSLYIPNTGREPIFMTLSTLEKILLEERHKIDLEIVKDLPNLIKQSPLQLQSITQKKGIVIVLDKLDNKKNDIITAIHIAKEKGKYIVDEVVSAYGKEDLQFFIDRTKKADLKIYINKYTKEWTKKRGYRIPYKAIYIKKGS